MEWIVAAALALAGLLTAVGLWLGQRDPVTRHYKPDMGGLFRIGRSGVPPAPLAPIRGPPMAHGSTSASALVGSIGRGGDPGQQPQPYPPPQMVDTEHGCGADQGNGTVSLP